MLYPYLFFLFAVARELYQTLGTMKMQSSRRGFMKSAEYMELQLELFSENELKNLKHMMSDSSLLSWNADIRYENNSDYKLAKQEDKIYGWKTVNHHPIIFSYANIFQDMSRMRDQVAHNAGAKASRSGIPIKNDYILNNKIFTKQIYRFPMMTPNI